jgi:hypothetical protein
MKKLTKRIFALAGVLALGLGAVKAQSDGALLDALVKKGVLSDQEAEDIRASAAKDYSQTAAGKLALSDQITQLKIYGDARVRFEYLDEQPQNTSAAISKGYGTGSTTTNRNRYRLRVGADYTFTDSFNAGFELESGTGGDSANQTFGNGFAKESINVGLVYLQWKPTDWLTLTGGKQRNPIYSTDLVWDPDINPEGGSEVLSFTFPVGGGESSAPAPASTDPKAIVAPVSYSEPSDMSLTVGLTAAQFIYADNAENAPTPTSSPTGVADKTDIWMFVEQVPVQFNFSKTTFIKEVPGFTSYMGGGNNGLAGTDAVAGAGWTGSSATYVGPHASDDLQLFTAPGEFDIKLGSLPVKAYWDFSLNLDGNSRVQDVYLGNGQGIYASTTPNVANVQAQNKDLGDNVAWLAGIQVGQNKKKGDWSIKGDFRQVGLGAVDPNINDSDWGDSFLNQQGIKIQSVYNFTDFLTGSITYFDTWAYKNGLMNGSTTGQTPTGLPLATNSVASPNTTTVSGGTIAGVTDNLVGVHSTQRVQVDLQWKF